MGFNKKYVRSLHELKEELAELGKDKFIWIYSKADAFIGPSDSIKFIQDTLNSNKNSK